MTDLGYFQKSFLTLFRECFEAIPPGQDYTWFVQGREGVFDALDSVDAAQASRKPSAECSSIGAHLNHLLFALESMIAQIHGQEVQGTWESSWAKQEFSENEWETLRHDLRMAYEKVLAWLNRLPEAPGELEMTGVMAILPCSAYHLGAVRQLMKLA